MAQWQPKHDEQVRNIEDIIQANDLKLKLTLNTVIRHEGKIEELQDKMIQDRRTIAKPNIIIEGVLEDKNESRKQLFENIDKFFKEQLELPTHVKILDAYRMGKPSWSNHNIKVKLMHLSDKSLIFANASKLQGKKNARKRLFFIKEDMDAQQMEKRWHYRDLLCENKWKDEQDQLQIQMKRGNIYINNDLLKPKLQAPKGSDILWMTGEELATVWAVKLPWRRGPYRKKLRVFQLCTEGEKHQGRGKRFCQDVD